MYYVGIDPGVSGGIAVLSEQGQVIDATKMLLTERELLEWLRERLDWFANLSNPRGRAVLERVSASPQMGVVSAFTFGRTYGRLEMLLAALEIPFDYVTPGKWQQALACRSGGDKNITKRRAQQLFPSRTVTHAIADALLLAEYCRRVHTGIVPREKPHGEENRESENDGGSPSPRHVSGQAGADRESGRQRHIRRRVEQARATLEGRDLAGAVAYRKKQPPA